MRTAFKSDANGIKTCSLHNQVGTPHLASWSDLFKNTIDSYLNSDQYTSLILIWVISILICSSGNILRINNQILQDSKNPCRQTKIQDFFPVRRSARKTKKTVLEEKRRSLEEAVLSKREDGLAVIFIRSFFFLIILTMKKQKLNS